MAFRFNASEVFDMAAQIERNGAAFYRLAAANNEWASDLLLTLAKEEDKHLQIFLALKDEFVSDGADESAFDPDGVASLYLKAVANGHIFDINNNDPSKILKGSETIDEVLNIAMQAEKDSIVFFVGLKDMVTDNESKEKVSMLIAEEMTHVTMLVQAMGAKG